MNSIQQKNITKITIKKTEKAHTAQIVINPKLEKIKKRIFLFIKTKPMNNKQIKTEQDWKKELSDEQYNILREKGTEFRELENI